MTDQEMIEVYNGLDGQCGDIEDQMADLDSDRETICDQMNDVEEEWRKTHGCSCELIGIESSCSHDKN